MFWTPGLSVWARRRVGRWRVLIGRSVAPCVFRMPADNFACVLSPEVYRRLPFPPSRLLPCRYYIAATATTAFPLAATATAAATAARTWL